MAGFVGIRNQRVSARNASLLRECELCKKKHGAGRSMVEDDGIYLGFDPGGNRRFGVALLSAGVVAADTVSTVDDAIGWAVDACKGQQPKAAGIDTLLHWATGKGGLRPCDEQLRFRYPEAKNSVMSPNSLFGAMTIGGVALAISLRREWPHILLNETHPKVFYRALGKPDKLNAIDDDHAYDAALSAWVTWKGVAEGWPDIIGAHDTLIFPAGEVHYLWPAMI